MTACITSNPHFGFETPAEDVAASLAAHISGKTIIITGVTPGGLGARFLQAVSPYNPHLLILAGRSSPKLAEAAKAIESAHPGVATRTLELDLSSQASVRKAANEVLSWPEPIDVLVNNAAVMACPYQKTGEGLEMQFGTNHIGPFLFTNLIVEKLLQSRLGPRVVNVSSDGHRFGGIRWDDLGFSGGRSYDKWRAYGQSKTATLLFTLSLAEKLAPKGVTVCSVHPGHIMTHLGRYMSNEDLASVQALDMELGNKEAKQDSYHLKTLSQGAATHVVAAFDSSLDNHSGAYLLDCQLAPDDELKPYATNKGSAERLWKLSENIVGQTFCR